MIREAIDEDGRWVGPDWWMDSTGVCHVVDKETREPIGQVMRHIVTAEQRAAWAAARPRGGDWISLPYFGCVPQVSRTRPRAIVRLWEAWRDRPEVPAP